MPHRFQLLTEPNSIPTEEIGIGFKDKRNIEQRYAGIFQSPHIIEPKLILDEESRHKMVAFHPLCGMTRRIGRKVKHLVGQRVVLAHLVARRRKKRKQNLVLGKLLLQCLDNRSSLLELAQRGCMEPNPSIAWLSRRLSQAMLTSFHPLHGLDVAKQRRNPHAEGIKQDAYGI